MTVSLDLPTLDADLGDDIAAGRYGPPPADLASFERAFMTLVESGGTDNEQAWDAFYDATLARVATGWALAEPGHGTVSTFTRIWSRAAHLSRGPVVLDVGTCFGFFPLAWASRAGAPRLLAAELSWPSAHLAARQARRLGTPLDMLCADGSRLPLGDRSVDTVLLLHILEHLPADECAAVLAEARRVADRRVVVAVPIEAVPDPVFGHVQTFDLISLADLGRCHGWHPTVSQADGAWLVLDRTDTPHHEGFSRPSTSSDAACRVPAP